MSPILAAALSSELIQASGVIAGLVLLSVLTIRAGDRRASESIKSMERVVALFGANIQKDLRGSREASEREAHQVREDFRVGREAASREIQSLRKEVLKQDARMTEIGSSVNHLRRDHGHRLGFIERVLDIGVPPSPRDSRRPPKSYADAERAAAEDSGPFLAAKRPDDDAPTS